MKILFAASEAVPFVKTGGLADVAGSLPAALRDSETECRVVLPLYGEIPQELRGKLTYKMNFFVPVSWRNQYCGVFESVVSGVTYYLLDNEYYFKRDGLYGHYDDGERFTFFARAVLEMLRHIDFHPDILHANDWHTALIPYFYRVFYAGLEQYRGIKTVFTIHNIEYQGKFGMDMADDVVGAPEWSRGMLEYNGSLNFMKAAIVSADAVTTVSPSYSYEVRYPYFSHGLDGILVENARKISGILNGIDNEAYNPETDACIFKNYSSKDLSGKLENKRGLQDLLSLPRDDDALVIGMIGRLVEAKGIELVCYVLKEMLSDHVQFVLLGKGEWKYEHYFGEMARRFPGRLAVRIAFANDLARKIYAGADVLLMPSKSEPCGLAQMVAMRYGTIPVVRQTGGLADSVKDCGDGKGCGFTFKQFNAHDMLGAIRRAEGMFADKNIWNPLVGRAMACDFGWKQSAAEYRRLYGRLTV